MFCEWWDFSILAGETGTIPSSLWSLRVVPSAHFGWFFSWPYIHTLNQPKIQEELCTSLEFSFCPALSFPVLCPANSSCLGFPDSGLCLWSTWSCLGSISLHRCLETLSGSKLEQSQGSPCLFPVSQRSLFFVAWCTMSENYCFHFVWFFTCFRQEGKSSPCYSILARIRGFYFRDK